MTGSPTLQPLLSRSAVEPGIAVVADAPRQPVGPQPFAAPALHLGGLDGDATALIVASAGDVALVVGRDGIIRDVALGTPALAAEGFDALTGQSWSDCVSVESRPKVAEMLAAAMAGTPPRWRELNHETPAGTQVAIRYIVVPTRRPDGHVIAIGRDMRNVAALQQRLLLAQQSIERDYLRLRQAESRYRLLFDVASEAVLIVDSATRRISEANPAAQRLCNSTQTALSGQPLLALLAAPSHAATTDLLGAVGRAVTAEPVRVELASGDVHCLLSATLFRQDQSTYFLVRLTPEATAQGAMSDDAGDRLLTDLVERLPDAFVVTDAGLNVLTENTAFLDLAQLARREQARGQPLGRFLGRPGIDLQVLIAHLRDHGSVRNFATILRSQYQEQEDVEVSAVAVTHNDAPCYGFSIRSVARRLREVQPGIEVPRSVEQLTELVGRVSLKEIVRESTDLIERLCIEAALNFTSDNRASAAEILGLSRQSLYSKLHRHGLGNLLPGSETN